MARGQELAAAAGQAFGKEWAPLSVEDLPQYELGAGLTPGRARVKGCEMLGCGKQLGVLSPGTLRLLEGAYPIPPREQPQEVGKVTPIMVAPILEGLLVDALLPPLVDVPPSPVLNDLTSGWIDSFLPRVHPLIYQNLTAGGRGPAPKPPVDDNVENPRMIDIRPRELDVDHDQPSHRSGHVFDGEAAIDDARVGAQGREEYVPPRDKHRGTHGKRRR